MSLFRYSWRSLVREIVLVAVAAFWFIPIYILLVFDFKKSANIYSSTVAPPIDPTLDNFKDAWRGTGHLSIGMALINSTIVTLCSVALLILFGSLAAYVLARRKSKLSTFIYLLFVLGLVIPFQLGIVPLYTAMRHLHLVGSLFGMILLYTGVLMPLTVFLYTGFVLALPTDYEESARVDGAGLLRTFVRVIFPLLRPVTVTVALLNGVIIWNDFFNPLIFLSGTDKATLPVYIYSFVNQYLAQYNLIFATVTMSILPILIFYLFAQRQLIRGFSGGIKG